MIVVEFKSNSENYEKEIVFKNNTFRKVDSKDERFISLRNGDAKRIVIRFDDQWFMRDIVDYTEYKGYGIITWRNE